MNKKTGVITTIIVVVLCSLIGRFAGHLVGKSMGENMSKSRQMREIDKFMENTAEYESGKCTDKAYTSDFWGMKFEANNNWVMYDQEALDAASQQTKDATISGGMSGIEGEELDEEVVEKWKSSVYAAVEMGASYQQEGVILGECSLSVMSVYGIQETSFEEYCDNIKKGLQSQTTSTIKQDTQKMAGRKFTSMQTTINIDGVDLVTTLFIAEKDDMVCMINCKYVDGYEYVLDSFIKQVSKY